MNIPEWGLGPENVKQIDILPELPPSGGYKNIITAIDVFLRHTIVCTVSSLAAVNTAKVLIDIMTRHACLRTVLITDKCSYFVPNGIHEIADNLSITLRHATTNLLKLLESWKERTPR